MTKNVFIEYYWTRASLFFESELMYVIKSKHWIPGWLPIFKAWNSRKECLATIHCLPNRSTNLFGDIQFVGEEKPVYFFQSFHYAGHLTADTGTAKYDIQFNNVPGRCQFYMDEELVFDCVVEAFPEQNGLKYTISMRIEEVQIRHLLKLFCSLFPLMHKRSKDSLDY